MIGARPPRGSAPSAPFPRVTTPSLGGTAAMIFYFLDRDQNDFFCDLLLLPSAAVMLLARCLSAPVTLLLPAAAATGLPALAAVWLALASSGRMNSIGLPSAFSNSALETVPSRPPSRLATKITRALGATCCTIVCRRMA